ncbi:LemA family protein [Candidatus Marsarchaeota archaeon]|nr:LemA family protein [Candidatus Marsarchaeota archaeon]MCL5404358.1 LemA family protein [Candidatus Marsarchaeota archaeon]
MSLLLYAIVGLAVIIIAGLVIVIYNSLVALRNNAKKAWADIDVLLEKRHDALGKLIDAVSGYMKYEKGLMTQLTQLRSQWMDLPQGDVQAKMNASNQVSSALKSVFAVAENYPDLKANNSFIQLQQSILTLESQIADRREFYNQSVTDLNIRIQQFPYNLLAGAMGFSAMTLFQVPEEAKADVKINFDMHQ